MTMTVRVYAISAEPRTLEIKGNVRTIVVVFNPNLRGTWKWFCYDRADRQACTDPGTKADTLSYARRWANEPNTPE